MTLELRGGEQSLPEQPQPQSPRSVSGEMIGNDRPSAEAPRITIELPLSTAPPFTLVQAAVRSACYAGRQAAPLR